MAQYLLGELPEADRIEFEDLYLNNSDMFQALAAVENEMIDQYVLDELSPTERERFEKSYMTNPVHREAVEVARSLLTYSAAQDTNLSQPAAGKPNKLHRRWLGQIAVAAVLILACGVSSLLVINHRLRSGMERLQREQATLIQNNQILQRQADRLRTDLQERDAAIRQMAQLAKPDTVSLTLGSGALRGEDESSKLTIPPGALHVLLRVVIEGQVRSPCTVSVSTVEGIPTWRKKNVQGRTLVGGTEIAVKLPSSLLQNGDYIVRVSAGGDDITNILAGYTFQVLKR